MGLSISRSRLVACAEAAIGRTSDLDPGDVDALRRVAREMSAVVANAWRAPNGERGPCGCLVGTLIPDVEDLLFDDFDDDGDTRGLSDAMYDVGIRFNVLLCLEIGLSTAYPAAVHVVEVTADIPLVEGEVLAGASA